MVLSLCPKGVQGFRGARAVSAGPHRAYSLTFEAARCDVNVDNPAGTHNRLQSAHNGSTRACRFEKVLFQFFDRGNARTYAPHAAPPPQRREGRRGQASSHTLPQSLPSPALLLLSSDNICTPQFIKSMTFFLLPVLNNLYIQTARTLSLPLYFLCKRETTKGGFHRLVLHDLFLRYTRPFFTCFASSCCIGWCCRLWTPWIERDTAAAEASERASAWAGSARTKVQR